ncbi:hypothetical protein [Ornithinimicrobium murale]|nr:hypothetical protein [Ornithinimicrobium murale]
MGSLLALQDRPARGDVPAGGNGKGKHMKKAIAATAVGLMLVDSREM